LRVYINNGKKDGKVKGVEAAQMLSMTKATFYCRVKEYEGR